MARSSTPNTLSVQIPGTGNGASKPTVNASHSMPNVSDGQINTGVDVSVEDVSESKSESANSTRAPSIKSPSKGKFGVLRVNLACNITNCVILMIIHNGASSNTIFICM